MDSEGSSDQGARFQFIDISSSNARKEARAHVMREFMRQKREEQPDGVKATKKARKRTKKPVDQSSQPLDVAQRKRVRQVADDKQDSSPVETESDSSASGRPESSASDKLSHPDGDTVLVRRPSMRLATGRSRSGSPQSMVDASRRDPFQSLPMWLDEEDRPLVDHYITVVPELMCNFKGMRLKSGVTTFNPTRDVILPQAMENPIAFQATALAFAAGHLARLHGRSHSDQSLKHRIQTLRKLREHFFGQNKHNDDLDIMVAMLSLASCEDRFGDNTAAWIHMRACVNMLENLIGKLDFKKDRRLYTYMNWILITMTGWDSCALAVLITPTSSPTGYSSYSPSILSASSARSEGVEDTMNAINAFVEFLRRVEQLNRDNLTQPESPIHTTRTRRKENFQPGSALYKLLSSKPGARPGVRSYQIQKSCRFASAVHINAVLLELSDNFEDSEQFLKRLSIRIIEQELDWNESTETLVSLSYLPVNTTDAEAIWIGAFWPQTSPLRSFYLVLDRCCNLASNVYAETTLLTLPVMQMWLLLFGDEDSERAFNQSQLTWWVGRTLIVAKRLSEKSWDEVLERMLLCLMIKKAAKEEEFEKWLNELHKELLAAPLSSHLSGP